MNSQIFSHTKFYMVLMDYISNVLKTFMLMENQSIFKF